MFLSNCERLGGALLKDVENSTEQKHRKNRPFIFLVIFYSLTLCATAFLLGKSSGFTGYSGQLIDTIILSSARKPDGSDQQASFITITGTVAYTNGEPYRNGVLELQSEPRYTTTDDNGVFYFQNVPVGSHTISIIENGTVLVSRQITLDMKTNSDDITYKEQSSGVYTVEIPVKISTISLALVVKDKGLTITDVSKSSPISTALPQSSNSQTSTGPQTSDGQQSSTTPRPSASPQASVSPQASASPQVSTSPTVSASPSVPIAPSSPEDTGHTPNVEVGDDYKPGQTWTQMSSVDIFAKRQGNTGVQNINGKNVIAPGSKGTYIFKLKNPETYDLLYTITLTEPDNSLKLPMKYRISKGSSGTDYIGGAGWKNPADIAASNYTLAAGESEYYTIEWKWVSSSDIEDTAIGINSGDKDYILDIIVKVQQK